MKLPLMLLSAAFRLGAFISVEGSKLPHKCIQEEISLFQEGASVSICDSFPPWFVVYAGCNVLHFCKLFASQDDRVVTLLYFVCCLGPDLEAWNEDCIDYKLVVQATACSLGIPFRQKFKLLCCTHT